MEKQTSSAETKTANTVYTEIIKLLKSRGETIKKDICKTRSIRPCREVQMAREHLEAALETVTDNPKVWHIQLLMVAIRNVIYLLEQTKGKFHSKELMRIREYADNLLKDAKTEYSKAIKKYK